MASIVPSDQVELARNLAIAIALLGIAVAVALGVSAMTRQSRGGASPAADSPAAAESPAAAPSTGDPSIAALPSPDTSGGRPLNDVLHARRSIREFAATTLTDRELGQLLWAAQGVTGDGHRTAPSAGALYPLEAYAVSAAGVARYLPAQHGLQWLDTGDRRADLADAALGQVAVREAPIVLVITGVTSRTAERYGDRADRYVALEAGHAAQNVLLEAVSLGLVAVPMGAFDDARVAAVLGLAAGEQPLYLIPVGHPR